MNGQAEDVRKAAARLPHSKKQNAPTGVGARKTGRAVALLYKKSVLGGAGTHFSTALILPGSYCTCQEKNELMTIFYKCVQIREIRGSFCSAGFQPALRAFCVQAGL